MRSGKDFSFNEFKNEEIPLFLLMYSKRVHMYVEGKFSKNPFTDMPKRKRQQTTVTCRHI